LIKQIIESTETMKHNQRIYFILFMLLFSFYAEAQRGTIRGRVFDEQTNEPIPFASVIITETTIGATSDLDGNFLITGVAPGFKKLRGVLVGYEARFTEEFMVTNAIVSYH
jgi:hypothetical protein